MTSASENQSESSSPVEKLVDAVSETAQKIGQAAIGAYSGQLQNAIGRWNPKIAFLSELLRQVQPAVISSLVDPVEQEFVDLVHRTHDFVVDELRKVVPAGTKLPVLK